MSKNQGFTIVFNDSMSRIENPNAQLVFYWLCSFRNSVSDLCCPTIKTICRKSKLSRSTVKRAIDYLNETKIIQKHGAIGDRNKYTIKDNKNKKLNKNWVHTEPTLVPSEPTLVHTEPTYIRYNNTNNNTTNYTTCTSKFKLLN